MKNSLLILTLVLLQIIPVYAQPDFTAYTAGNPVIPRGGTGSWDRGSVWSPIVTVVNDTFYMVYNGTVDYYSQPAKIGLATSTDGYTFTKSPSNPILSGDGSGFDSYSVWNGPLVYDNASWYLYYTGVTSQPVIPGRIISRATADNPQGPWIRTDDTLMTSGSSGEWDDKFVFPVQILPTDTGLVMYYLGSDDWVPYTFKMQIGLATSTDGGQTWQKYDDPATTSPPYAESDPVVTAGPESYDIFSIFGAGMARDGGEWEMIYSGFNSNQEGAICYATSSEGIHWTKYPGNPIYTFWEDPLAVYGSIEGGAFALVDYTYFLYYDYGIGPNSSGIGLAADPPIVGIEPPVENKISNFTLFQNYPNPFNPSTVISWQLARLAAGQAVGNLVQLSIYDLSGREVVMLVNEVQAAGLHQIEFNGSGMVSGVYFYRLSAGQFQQTKKLLLMK